ncbi:iron ABC transporter permease [Salicibibacter cibi]|uniref:Iron ABC transporter permease n=1 Tax=Salicibibacter cibi TaxID=2743001 RepID=A0A7T6ZCN3_9BACI|nr:iron ABC transporter permease [Salicibibacter cibi]QQK81083.1 iron ABC transporter permease [Salicibibacter cibi]
MKPNTTSQSQKKTPIKNFLKKVDSLQVIKWLITGFFILFLIIPLISVFIISFTNEPVNIFGSFVDPNILSDNIGRIANASLDQFRELFTGGTNYFAALNNSLLLAVSVSIIVILMCLPIAYGFARTSMPFKGLFAALCTMPVVVPTFISAAGFIIMFGRTGWTSTIFNSIFGTEGGLFDVYSMTAIVLVQVFFFFPLALWPMVAAFKIADIQLEEASRNMGARSWSTMLFVTVPLALPGMISSALLIFAVSFSDFGTPIILAPEGLNLIVVEAYREISGFFNWGGAAILTVVMVGVAAIFFWLQRLVTKKMDYGTLSGKPRATKLNNNKAVKITLSVYTSIVVLVPTLAILSVFLQSLATTWGADLLPNGLTFDHYQTIFTRSTDNIVNSIVLAGGALLICVIVGTFISYFVVRQKSSKLDFLATIPLVVPGIALGIAFIQTFNTAPLQLTGTAFILIVAYAIRRLPYMIRSTTGSMMAIRSDIEEASVNLGASKLMSLVTIVGPLMLPGIAAGSILVFVTVIRETSITILMAPTQWSPMSLEVFQNLMRGDMYNASAMAVVIIVLVLVLQTIGNRISNNSLY